MAPFSCFLRLLCKWCCVLHCANSVVYSSASTVWMQPRKLLRHGNKYSTSRRPLTKSHRHDRVSLLLTILNCKRRPGPRKHPRVLWPKQACGMHGVQTHNYTADVATQSMLQVCDEAEAGVGRRGCCGIQRSRRSGACPLCHGRPGQDLLRLCSYCLMGSSSCLWSPCIAAQVLNVATMPTLSRIYRMSHENK